MELGSIAEQEIQLFSLRSRREQSNSVIIIRVLRGAFFLPLRTSRPLTSLEAIPVTHWVHLRDGTTPFASHAFL
ncbi:MULTISPECIES: hypothetical protein [unclassified Stenotrophomonas]|uniref:hypothetical protein n=1 Tax=unclassified Stenotrophomonas TaxID=196198 RepID=UPI00190D3E82|nr:MULTISPECIES: hypothetical protein [unclassified Stenotrophomonas]MBK0054553.1 hypothetical protein [Stenotrophomonas sp. S39]MDI9271600.1 hypothetical protein [Stenotrophomonas sp. PFBMAA-4]